MDNQVQQIVDKWKSIIESIETKGFSRKIDFTNFFRMNKFYTGYPDIEFCYKVDFRFDDCLEPGSKNCPTEWGTKLKNTFKEMYNESIVRHGDGGEMYFHNSRIDYITYQGYRFIIQFYPMELISDLRDEKIDKLIN